MDLHLGLICVGQGVVFIHLPFYVFLKVWAMLWVWLTDIKSKDSGGCSQNFDSQEWQNI